MTVSIIVAVSENSIIGRDNDLPWHLPADLKHFMTTTRGHPVVMGRKTFQSLQQPLTDRPNIVITRDPTFTAEGATITHSLDEALAAARAVAGEDSEIFILGGSEIFRQALPLADRLYLTRVHAHVDGDVAFPEWDPSQWKLVDENHHPADDRHAHAMTFQLYTR